MNIAPFVWTGVQIVQSSLFQDAPQGRFSDLAVLEPVKAYPARHASTLLAFEAVLAAVREAQTRSSRTSLAG